MTMQISIDVQGSVELQQALAAAVQRLEVPRDLMRSLGAVFEEAINRRFDNKVDPSGKAWAVLADSTRKKYDREDTRTGRDGKRTVVRKGTLLQRTNLMRKSLGSNAGDDFVELGMNRATDDGKWIVALLHEFGTRRGMPRRGIYLADPEAGTLGAADEAALLSELESFLDEVFGA
jgi:phage gpG-like protein